MIDTAADLLWIIPCCSTKKTDVELAQQGIAPSNKDGFTQFTPYRKCLISSLTADFDSWECGSNKNRPQAKVTNKLIKTGQNFCALNRYDGKLYQRLTDKARQAILNRGQKFDLLILSALYGLLRPGDGIAY